MALVGKKRESVPDRPSPLMPRLNPLSDPRIRSLVRMAAVEGAYDAVKEAYALAKSLVPPGTDLWSWWLDGVEDLAQVGDQDRALFVKFSREVAGLKPWGDLPPAGRHRLTELSLLP
jgi:hypothetical protein